MRSKLIALTCLLVMSSGAAYAQQQQGMRPGLMGTVKSVSATEMVLTTADGDVTVGLTPTTRVLSREAGSVSDIQPGAYLGTSNHTAADGQANQATEVHVMSNGPNVMQQMDPAHDPSLMMTNGHVTNVTTTAAGTEMDVDYGGSETRHVVVSNATSMTRMTDAGVAGLHEGEQVSARTTTDADGHQVATFILIGGMPH